MAPGAGDRLRSPVWLGIDLGTGGVRALAVSADGTVVGRGERGLQSRRDGPRHEQDAESWWEALGGAARDAVREIAPERVAGLAACATSGTILLVGRAGEPLTPALMYDDGRAAEQAGRIGAPRAWALPKLLWLLEERPELAGAGRLAHQADFITRRLAGREVACDSSHALKSGYDLAAGCWPAAVRGLVPAGVLPEVVRPGGLLGSVCPAAAAHTGIAAGTPIFAGMTDGCAAQIAGGALRVGDWSSALGTTLVLKGVSEAPIGAPGGAVYSHRAPDGEWLPGAASSCGAGALEAAFAGRDLDELTRRAASHAETRVIAYPLVGRGERFPFCAGDACAFVVGEPSGEDELFAALLQGLAFVERLCFDVLDALGAPTGGELTVSGGTAANRDLCQLRADALGRPVRVPDRAESAFGAAMLAAARGRRLAEVAAEMVGTRERFAPDAGRGERLAAPYADFVGELRRRGWLSADAAAHALR